MQKKIKEKMESKMKIFAKNHNLISAVSTDVFSLNGDSYLDITVLNDGEIAFTLWFIREAKDRLFCPGLFFYKGRDNNKIFEISFDMFMDTGNYNVTEWKQIRYIKFNNTTNCFKTL